MKNIRINTIIELYPSVYLVVFFDKEVSLSGVEIVTVDSSVTTTSGIAASISDDTPRGYHPKDSDVEVVIDDIDKELLEATRKWCSKYGIIMEQLVVAILRFYAAEENRHLVKSMYESWSCLEEE